MDEKKEAIAVLTEFLEREGLVIVPVRPQVTFTESGGVIIQPAFSVQYKDQYKGQKS